MEVAPSSQRWRFQCVSALCLFLGADPTIGFDSESSGDAISEVEISSDSAELVIANDDGTGTATFPTVPLNSTSKSIPPHLKDCGIWLAPSAIKGAGLGMYAGRHFSENEELQVMGDPVIPIIDKHLHNDNDSFEFLWDEYIWNGWVVGMDFEGFENADGASPGFGSTANSFIPLVNVEEGVPKRHAGGLHRLKDPGAGAFTAYFDRQSTATRPIEAGEEFYVDYGEHWFEHRTYLGPVPLGDDLEKATTLFHAYRLLKKSLSTTSDEVLNDLWDTFVRKTEFVESRVIGSFHHDDDEELLKLEKIGSVHELRVKEATKSLEWLYEFGTCGDHIYGATSTLEQAGRGAFASRDLPEGAVIAQLPLIHITNRSRLDMYHFEAGPYSSRTEPRPPQLLLNYCYGHSQSTLLLCPYGPIVSYVNHNQSLANVKIRWADPARGNFMPHLLENDLDALEVDDTAKLAFELVATRSIHKDEEVFLDYGDAWEQAWQEHLRSWKPIDGADLHMTQDEIDRRERFDSWRTVFEQIENPYPPNIKVECHVYFEGDDWKSKSYGRIREELERKLENNSRNDWFECDILRRYREDEMELYTATAVGDEAELLLDLPDIAFRFREKPYTSDMFLENAFRHDIGVPDEIFPDAWRNVRSNL
ncbi:hypothetical protein ACA910_012510 [Epithemia clementina (nom. ined.)]